MTFEAYKVAVKISLIDGVTAGVLGMSRVFAKAHDDVGLLQKRLDRLKFPALASGALLGAGVAGLELFKRPLEEAERYQDIMGRLAAQGVGDIALKQADKFAKGMNIIGASNSDTLKMVAEANSVLRNMSEAQAVAPMLLKMKFGIESVMSSGGHGGGHGEKAERMFMDALKTTELRGALIDPKTGHFSEERFAKQLDFMTKAYTASGGLVKPTEYLNMIKTGGVAAKSLNDQSFYFGLMHMAQEQGGSRTGTGLMSAFQNMYMGRTTQQVAEEMNKMGLFNTDKLHYGTTGHLAKVDAGSLKRAELFRTDQFAYMNQVMLPMLRAQGVHDGEQMKMGIAKLFSNRVGGSQWVTMYMERANIQKHIDAAKGAMGVDALAAQGDTQLSGKRIELQAKMDKLMLAFGEHILPMAITMLERLNPMLEKMAGFMREHSTAVKALAIGLGGLAIAATVAGGIGLLGVTINALQIAMGAGMAGAAGSALGLGLRAIGMGVMFLSRALLLNPIGLVVTGIVAAIYGLYTYWDKIKAWLPNWMTGSNGTSSGGVTRAPNNLAENAAGLAATSAAPNSVKHDGMDHSSRAKIDPVRSAHQSVHVTVNNTVDEHGIASIVTRYQSKWADRPQSGSSGHDGRMSSVSPTLAGAGG